jgi:hypothetical protein
MLHSLWMISLILIVACNSRPEHPNLSLNGGKVSAAQVPTDENPLGGNTFDLNFLASRPTLRSVPYIALVNKLKVVSGLNDDSEAVKQAVKVAQSIGSYNHAQGVLPDNNWTIDKMGIWMQVADSACRVDSVLKRIQAAEGDTDFIEAAYGRDLNAADQDMLKDLNAANLDATRRARVLCNVVLLSAEFVSL